MVKILGIYANTSGAGKTVVSRLIQNFTLRLPNAYRLGHKQIMGVDQDTQSNSFAVLDNHSSWQMKPLKEIPAQSYAKMFGIDRSLLESREWKNAYNEIYGMKNNDHFIKFAEGNKALFGEDLYADALFRDYDPEEQKIIIPDVRNKNEMDAIKARGGKMLRLFRRQTQGAGFSRDGLLEKEWFDFFIDNSYSFWKLSNNVIRMMIEFKMFIDEKQYNFQPPDEWHPDTIRSKMRDIEDDESVPVLE